MYMARVISVVNQKGGVGKTTTAINFAAALALMKKRVLLVDMDSQGNATSGVGVDAQSIQTSVYDVLVGTGDIKQSIVTTAIPQLHVLPSSIDVAGASVELVEAESREFRLRKAIEVVVPYYDYIIVDCPPALGLLTINGIVASDEVLIPVQAEYYALEGLGQLLQTIQLIQEHVHSDLTILGAVITMFDKRNRLSKAVLEDINSHFPYRVFESIIPRNVRLAEAPSFAQTIFEYDRVSPGAFAYKKLAQEVDLILPPILDETSTEIAEEQSDSHSSVMPSTDMSAGHHHNHTNS